MRGLDKQGCVSASLLFLLTAAVLWIGWMKRRRSRLGSVLTAYLVFYLVFCLLRTNSDAVDNVNSFALTVAPIPFADGANPGQEDP